MFRQPGRIGLSKNRWAGANTARRVIAGWQGSAGAVLTPRPPCFRIALRGGPMSLTGLLVRLFPGRGHGVRELARRLDLRPGELRRFRPVYMSFSIPKKSGGRRLILAPSPELKALQRRILRRVLGRLRSHACATGFERGYSIVSNAVIHAGKEVVVRIDVKNFFPSTRVARVHEYFRAIGWNRDASRLLIRLCCKRGGLPQGAPTSPRLSNLVNYRLDARLAAIAERRGSAYSRYVDDLTFSFATNDRDSIRVVIRGAKRILGHEGYRAHRGKLRVSRRHRRQMVTGLIVNDGVRLPRETRRWLRAVEHRIRAGRETTLTPSQLAGWRSLESMVARQVATLALGK